MRAPSQPRRAMRLCMYATAAIVVLMVWWNSTPHRPAPPKHTFFTPTTIEFEPSQQLTTAVTSAKIIESDSKLPMDVAGWDGRRGNARQRRTGRPVGRPVATRVPAVAATKSASLVEISRRTAPPVHVRPAATMGPATKPPTEEPATTPPTQAPTPPPAAAQPDLGEESTPQEESGDQKDLGPLTSVAGCVGRQAGDDESEEDNWTCAGEWMDGLLRSRAGDDGPWVAFMGEAVEHAKVVSLESSDDPTDGQEGYIEEEGKEEAHLGVDAPGGAELDKEHGDEGDEEEEDEEFEGAEVLDGDEDGADQLGDLGGDHMGFANRKLARSRATSGSLSGIPLQDHKLVEQRSVPAGGWGVADEDRRSALQTPRRRMHRAEGLGSRPEMHASFALLLPDGALLLTWFHGPGEGSGGVGIVVSKLERGGSHWTQPRYVSRDDCCSAQNPVLYHDAATGLVHLWHTSQLADQGQGTSQLMWLQSADLGESWTVPQVIDRRPGIFTRHPLLPATDGQLLWPVYFTPSGYGGFKDHYSVLRIGRANSTAWKEVPLSFKGQSLAQPTVVRLACGAQPHRLLALFRDRSARWVWFSTSDDEGRSWTAPEKTRIPNNNSGIQVHLLRSGALLLVFNNERSHRFPVTAALSYDCGRSWPYVRDMDVRQGGGSVQRYDYPVVQDDLDGWINVFYSFNRYTIKHVRFTEAWIRHGGTVGLLPNGTSAELIPL